MSQYRKKPVVIDAWQWNGGDFSGAPEWLNEAETVYGQSDPGRVRRTISVVDARDVIEVYTLVGTMFANVGDWIIRGVAGDLYPCKPAIFAAIYEPVTEPASSTDSTL